MEKINIDRSLSNIDNEALFDTWPLDSPVPLKPGAVEGVVTL